MIIAAPVEVVAVIKLVFNKTSKKKDQQPLVLKEIQNLIDLWSGSYKIFFQLLHFKVGYFLCKLKLGKIHQISTIFYPNYKSANLSKAFLFFNQKGVATLSTLFCW